MKRKSEYLVLLYRLFLVYLFYFIERILFYLYNKDILNVSSFSELMSLCYHAIPFDSSAIFYINILFILLSVLPLKTNTSDLFQKRLFYLYFITNLPFYATNFIDFIYYKFSQVRSTAATFEVIKNETNKSSLFLRFLVDYWHVFFIFIVCSIIWIRLYRLFNVKHVAVIHFKGYAKESLVVLPIVALISIGALRGSEFGKSSRPINIIDAGRFVTNMKHTDIVLNTPFSIIRTLTKNDFKKVHFDGITDSYIKQHIEPIKFYPSDTLRKPNVVLLIMESFGKEYLGSFNKNSGIHNYVGHTPFLDSLTQYSLKFTNAFANGRISLHGLPSILAGIPPYKDKFTSSPYAKQEMESLISTLESVGYHTSFYHGAANGSMGFQGFVNILGMDNYIGKNEFNDNSQDDGFWGIWDEPFLQFVNQKITKQPQPFFSTIFTLTSHHPYQIPEKYKSTFKEGKIKIHKSIEYSDYALKQFFNAAKKQTWFKNTLFVIVADHCNMPYYDEYKKQLNRFAIPILFYKPDGSLKGENVILTQQLDIYPSILDYIGYSKPFRSWGKSVFDTKGERHVIISTGSTYTVMNDTYVCVFDGKTALGFYKRTDTNLDHNLIHERNSEMNALEKNCKAFFQDYMNRIVDRKLGIH